jgi:1-acyl-sn-glycerol-3-phosphate acyltransferase
MSAPAIPARPADWAVAGLRAYVRNLAARRFHGWHVRASDFDALRDRSLPLLFLANHTSWWDGFFALELAAYFDQRFFVMMQRDQLAAIPFFARCGAFSMDRDHPRQAHRDLRYAAGLLQPGHGVWVFPQGKRRPAGAPVVLEPGVGRLATWGGPVRVVPVALRYTFISEDSPEAFAWLGLPWTVEPNEQPDVVVRAAQASLGRQVALLDEALVNTEREGFVSLLEGAPSVNLRFEALMGKLGLRPSGLPRNG